MYELRVGQQIVWLIVYKAPSAKNHFWGNIIEYSAVSVVMYFLWTHLKFRRTAFLDKIYFKQIVQDLSIKTQGTQYDILFKQWTSTNWRIFVHQKFLKEITRKTWFVKNWPLLVCISRGCTIITIIIYLCTGIFVN